VWDVKVTTIKKVTYIGWVTRLDTLTSFSLPAVSIGPHLHFCLLQWKLDMSHGKMRSQDTAGLYAAAAVLRLALFTFFPALPDLLTSRVEVSTPVTSFKRCKSTATLPSPLPLSFPGMKEC
jgi:hypothetical protein